MQLSVYGFETLGNLLSYVDGAKSIQKFRLPCEGDNAAVWAYQQLKALNVRDLAVVAQADVVFGTHLLDDGCTGPRAPGIRSFSTSNGAVFLCYATEQLFLVYTNDAQRRALKKGLAHLEDLASELEGQDETDDCWEVDTPVDPLQQGPTGFSGSSSPVRENPAVDPLQQGPTGFENGMIGAANPGTGWL